ncbi:hypothetical protein DB31_6404 [Hyalangium minutum]|uniref:Uncharacterized protein n=1 Tax=Hyalangium minutum TaxID=394096 RepID=A0A085WP16_9BACT|nr:hypothetical protein DB31_6404 [Hyalangium minutum]
MLLGARGGRREEHDGKQSRSYESGLQEHKDGPLPLQAKSRKGG